MERLPDIIHESWRELLQPLFDHESMKELKYRILPNCKFYPTKQDIFKVFRQDINNIKVVLLGQDPYVKKGEATGLAFAVPENVMIPKSLQIIAKDWATNFTNQNSDSYKNKNLEWLEEQGVFLLNTALTVEVNNPASHTKYWKYFIQEVIKILASKHLIWMLWGSHARKFKEIINPKIVIDGGRGRLSRESTNYILESNHPAAEYHSDGNGGFYGNNHRIIVNQLLEHLEKEGINFN